MIKVYIASPYTLGDKIENVRRQIDASNELMNLGFTPFVPLLFHYQNEIHPRKEEDWINLDNEWLLSCDCVLRLSGESKGSDDEIKLAIENNIPVFYSIKEIINWLKNKSGELFG